MPTADRTPTYCVTAPECFEARDAWQQSGDAERVDSFTTHNPTGLPSASDCAGRGCHSACDCDAGEACVDTTDPASRPGALCGTGQCVIAAIAEAIFDYAPADQIPCCGRGAPLGERCVVGWGYTPNPMGASYLSVVAREADSCAPDGVCCPGEFASTPADCTLDCGTRACRDPASGLCPACEGARCAATSRSTSTTLCGDGECTGVRASSCLWVFDHETSSNCADCFLYDRYSGMPPPGCQYL